MTTPTKNYSRPPWWPKIKRLPVNGLRQWVASTMQLVLAALLLVAGLTWLLLTIHILSRT